MKALFLTQNPTLVGTTRILREWLELGRGQGLEGAVCASSEGDLLAWAAKEGFAKTTNKMRWFDRYRPWQAIGDALQLSKWMRRHGIDLLHCNEHQIYPFAALVARFSGAPVVCHVRSLLTPGFSSWAFRKREPDALIWCTQHMADRGKETLAGCVANDRQHVIPLGLTLTAATKHEPTNEQVTVGMACFIRPGKRIQDFLELARRFAHRPNVAFQLAGGPARGDEPYFESLRPEIEDYVERGLLEWKGHVDPVEDFHRDVDIFVSTSEHESFGMSVCEAMACGNPIAAYAGGAVEEIVGDAGIVVPTGELDGLANALEQLIADPVRRQQLGAKGRDRVERLYSPEKNLVKLRRVYTSLVGEGSVR